MMRIAVKSAPNPLGEIPIAWRALQYCKRLGRQWLCAAAVALASGCSGGGSTPVPNGGPLVSPAVLASSPPGVHTPSNGTPNFPAPNDTPNTPPPNGTPNPHLPVSTAGSLSPAPSNNNASNNSADPKNGAGSESAAILASPGAVETVGNLTGGSSTSSSDASSASSQKVPVTVHYILSDPTILTQTTRPLDQARSVADARRRPAYISPSNANITITVTPFGGGQTVYGPTACTSGTCTISFTANAGPNTLTFSLTDAGANVLSKFSTVKIVQPAVVNTLNFTANPVVDSVSLTLAAPTVNAGTPTDVALTVNALDKASNTIVGTGNYVDVNGNPVSLILATNNIQAGGNGSVYIKGSTRLTAPGQAAVFAHYDGKWLDHTDISVSTAGGTVPSLSGATLTTRPYAIEYSAGMSPGSGPHGICAGADGNVWFTEFGGSRIGKITPSGGISEFFSGITGGSQPHFIVTGPDGNIWFTEYSSARSGRLIPSTGAINEITGNTGSSATAITAGPDGALWFVESGGNKAGRLTTGGALTEFNLAKTGPRGIVTGPDGNLWIVYSGAYFLGRLTPDGVETDFAYPDVNGGAAPDGPVVGSDGNIWAPDTGGYFLNRSTPAGVITQFKTGITNNASIRTLTLGPDGNIWFTEQNTSFIGKITPAGTVTEYGTTNGVSGGSGPIGITVGQDGNLWFTEYSGNRIGRFIL